MWNEDVLAGRMIRRSIDARLRSADGRDYARRVLALAVRMRGNRWLSVSLELMEDQTLPPR